MSKNYGYEGSPPPPPPPSYFNSDTTNNYSSSVRPYAPSSPPQDEKVIMMQPMGQGRQVTQEVQYGHHHHQQQQQQQQQYTATTQFQEYHYQHQQTSRSQHQHEQNFAPIVVPPGPGPSMGLHGQTPMAIATNVPPGLECLVNLDQIIIKQKIELLEIFTGCETKNRYKIKSPFGQDLFSAKEDTDCCTRNCLGSLRPFDIKIKDGNDQEVIHLSRPFGCGSCCFPCCLQSIDVFSPPGNLIGRLEQDWTLIIPKFRVLNAQGEVVLRIKGPFCTLSCCCNDVEFQVLSPDGEVQVGKISKKWSGLAKEYFTDADNFGLSFPMDLDVKMKATMIGACMLIDFMFFEHKDNNN